MKRFWLFTFDDYYPLGGFSDFRSSYDSIEEAKQIVMDNNFENYQIVDSTTGLECA